MEENKHMLSKEEFVKYINLAKHYSNVSCEMYDKTNGGLDLWKCYIDDTNDIVPECALIELIKKCMNLKYETLEYFCYECSFGEDKNMIKLQGKIDEKFGKISSIEDLYDYIILEEME